MVTMTWGRSPPAAGRVPVVSAALQAPTRPSRSRCGRVRRSSSASGAPLVPSPLSGCRLRRRFRATRHRLSGRCCCVAVLGGAYPGAGVRGGVHDRQEGFALVRGREDFQVVESAAGRAEEHALAAAEFFLGRLRTVLVDRVGPAAGDPGEEVGVVFVLPCGSGRVPSGRWCPRWRGAGPDPGPE